MPVRPPIRKGLSLDLSRQTIHLSHSPSTFAIPLQIVQKKVCSSFSKGVKYHIYFWARPQILENAADPDVGKERKGEDRETRVMSLWPSK